MSSVPDQVSVTEVIKPAEAEIFIDHCIVSFNLALFIKAPPMNQRFAFDWSRGDFDGLRSSPRAANLSKLISTENADVNSNRHRWTDILLAGVTDYIPEKN